MKLMKYTKLYFVLSLIIILPGLYFFYKTGLKLGIDFTGGALIEYQFKKEIKIDKLKDSIIGYGIEVGQIIKSDSNSYLIRTKPVDQEKLNGLRGHVSKQFGELEEKRIENVGPVVGKELSQKAVVALTIASLIIVLYISFSFRKIPKPASSFRFGISAVAALIHDILVVIGAFAILGHFLGIEIDTLFVTALLTIVGFSVHDTIVVFDRIRENLIKNPGRKFIDTANISVVQTLGRSLNTSLTVVFVLLALFLFGGETIKWFVVALLIGIISGTYSSIFNATALLVWWEEKLGH